MGNILSGLVLVNGTDIWTEYGVFLVEDRRGGMDTFRRNLPFHLHFTVYYYSRSGHDIITHHFHNIVHLCKLHV